ncbi:hypothetical protein BD310DRAFT_973511 [Dichomitus squalens]|uniref:WH1-domain-containing protein n=1 Tax=Dichomitus squalens TaxID=114155 RepID=A0A4Q9Q7J6_9APHY|nr:hypothetical protein BD310DRAFT_973511 [Dichomitus squalens]
MAYPHPTSPAATISSLSSDERRSVLDYIPPDCKVIAVAPARIYHASFGAASDEWTSTGLRGMLVFGRNRITAYPDRPIGSGEGTSFEQNYWFRLIDLNTGKGIVWFHPLPQELDYHADKPFFHTFSGASRMFGLRFDEDEDAEKFRKRITSRIQIIGTHPSHHVRALRSSPNPSSLPTRAPAPTARRGPAKPRAQAPKSVSFATPPASGSPPPAYSVALPQPEVERAPRTPRKLSPAMISGPNPGSFVHVAHVGLDAQGRVESTPNVEPGWTMILEELQGYGVTEKMVEKDFNFVEGFLAGAKASLIQELDKTTTAAANIKRAPTESAARARPGPMRRKNVPVYF